MSVGIGRWVTAEAELAHLSTTDRTYRRRANILGYHVNALANLLPGDFRPFVLVGAGAMQIVPTAGDETAGLRRDTSAEFHVGVGFDYRLVDRFSIRGDARVMQMPGKENRGLTSDLEAMVGAAVTFGGGQRVRSRPPMAGEAAGLSPVVAAVPARLDELPMHLAEAPPQPPVRVMALSSEKGTPAGSTPHVTVSDLLERAKEIQFAGGTAKLSAAAQSFLDQLAVALVKEPHVRLEVVSHTADNGDARKDSALSRRRAEAVRDALVARGVALDRLLAVGRGSEEPIAPNITRTGRRRNERIELHRSSAASLGR
jgi:outer membrane protein OmpA-like peptidoglycan-associated protein